MAYRGRPRKRGRRRPIPKEQGAARSKVAIAIVQARRAAGLTQDQLGQRVGLTGRAVHRWERDEAAPSKRHRAALVNAFNAARPDLGTWFSQSVASATAPPKEATAPIAATPSTPSGPEAFERAVFTFADELDLPPRRARGALKRLVARLREVNVSLDTTEKLLEEWIARAV
jgi:transcriptional regulator with XRE-family HTH domain